MLSFLAWLWEGEEEDLDQEEVEAGSVGDLHQDHPHLEVEDGLEAEEGPAALTMLAPAPIPSNSGDHHHQCQEQDQEHLCQDQTQSTLSGDQEAILEAVALSIPGLQPTPLTPMAPSNTLAGANLWEPLLVCIPSRVKAMATELLVMEQDGAPTLLEELDDTAKVTLVRPWVLE